MGAVKSDIEIARKAKMKPIKDVLSKINVPDTTYAFSPQGRHINSGNTILPQGSPRGRHIDSGKTILPQGSPSGRHTQSPLGQGSLRKSPLAGE